MRPTRLIAALIGLLAIGGVAAGCGTTTQSRSAAARPRPPLAARPDPAHISFLAPTPGASVGPTVLARVKVSGRGRVRFILDAGRPRVAAGSAITYRQLAPGRHRLVARLLSFPGQRLAATATARFAVRRPATAVASPATAHPSSAAAANSTPTQPGAPSTHAAAPPARASTPSAPPPPPVTHASPPATHPPVPGGIPQGGGGDGDGQQRPPQRRRWQHLGAWLGLPRRSLSSVRSRRAAPTSTVAAREPPIRQAISW